MDMGWLIEFRFEPSFGEGFVVCISGDARPKDDDCSVWSVRGSFLELPPTAELMKQIPKRISRSDGAAIYEDLRRGKVGVVPPLVAGCDGATYILEVTAFFNSVKYKWWEKLPDVWSDLAKPVSSLTRLALEQAYV